jgi:hypothetical protein
VLTSLEEHVGQNHSIRTGRKHFSENVAKSKYLETTLTDDNDMLEQIHRVESRGISELLTKKYARRSLFYVAIGHKHVVLRATIVFARRSTYSG